MDILTARAHLNEGVYYRDRDLPACAPLPVRMMSTTPGGRIVCTTQLDGSKPASPDQCFEAEPEELHFELSGFDDISTDPCPPPSIRKTDPCPPSDVTSDRFISIDVIKP